MSAFMLPEAHIRYLVSAYVTFGLTIRDDDTGKPMGPSKIGAALYAENARSVSYRYPSEPVKAPAFTHGMGVAINRKDPREIAKVLKAIACYEYQSCECPDYEDTLAWRIITTLKDGVLSVLTHDVFPGLPWVIDEPPIEYRISKGVSGGSKPWRLESKREGSSPVLLTTYSTRKAAVTAAGLLAGRSGRVVIVK